jgi:hypothetical protein
MMAGMTKSDSAGPADVLVADEVVTATDGAGMIVGDTDCMIVVDCCAVVVESRLILFVDVELLVDDGIALEVVADDVIDNGIISFPH